MGQNGIRATWPMHPWSGARVEGKTHRDAVVGERPCRMLHRAVWVSSGGHAAALPPPVLFQKEGDVWTHRRLIPVVCQVCVVGICSRLVWPLASRCRRG